jgi:hypothetical protein
MRAVALALLCALCLLGLLSRDAGASTTAAASNSATFADSTGEDPSAADISAVTVSNDDRGRVTFAINVPNRPTLAPDMIFLILLDTDANPASGDPDFNGADYVIELDGPLGGAAGTALARWDGTNLTSSGVSQSSLVWSYSSGASISINASELGGTRRFGFSVLAVSGAALDPAGELDLTNARFDLAPDNGQHLYDVRITPPTLTLRSAGTRPLRPTAGKAYTVFTTFARSDTATPMSETVICRATIAGRAVAVTARSVVGSRASCTFRIPAGSKGKTIRGTVRVSSQGLGATRSFSARIV